MINRLSASRRYRCACLLQSGSEPDAERRRHYHYHTGHPWGQAEDYDLCLDISAYWAEVGATLLSQAVCNFVYSEAGRNAQASSSGE